MRHALVETVLLAVAAVMTGGAVAGAILMANEADCGARQGPPRHPGPSKSGAGKGMGGTGQPRDDCAASAGGRSREQAFAVASACTVSAEPSATDVGPRPSAGAIPSVGAATELVPGRIGERAVCGISGRTFVVSEDTPAAVTPGEVHLFCCADCPTQFLAGARVSGGPTGNGG